MVYAATASMTPMPKLVCEPTFVYADRAMRREKMRVASAPSTPLMRRWPSWAGIRRELKRPCPALRGIASDTMDARVKSCVASTFAIASRSMRGGASLRFHVHQRCWRLVAIVAGDRLGT